NSGLMPLGQAAEHHANGLVPRQLITVPFAPYYTYIQVQMAVWDGTLWGTNFSNVPTNQLGFTDIVPVEVVRGTDPLDFSPYFNDSAVVPPVPEPSTAGIVALGAVVFVIITRLARRSSPCRRS